MFDVMIEPATCEICLRPYAESEINICDSCAKDLEHGIIKWGVKHMLKKSDVKKYVVRGDHPILARPDKYGLTETNADALVKELEDLNYENITKEEL